MTEGPGPADPGPRADHDTFAPALPHEPEQAPEIEPALDPDPALEPEPEPAPGSSTPIPFTPPVESTRRLLGASFDLLTRTSEDMRRASFYIGLIALGTVAPLAVASFALEIISMHHSRAEMADLLAGGLGGFSGLLVIVAGIGLLTAVVESQAMAASILGGHLAGRPVTVRAALARSRMIFWRVILASIVVAIPVGIAQSIVDVIFVAALGPQTDVSFVTSVLVAALVGAPLAYVLAGVVLGDVDPLEATRRSFRVFRARKLAAVLVAIFETIAFLLVLLGLSAGLDVALRVFDALGLGTDSGPAGLILVVVGIAIGVFALGTLIYTALAISLAPQMVMFVGLTRATFGLDHVRPGGGHDPLVTRLGERRFRWLTRSMLAGFVTGILGLLGFLAAAANG